LVSQRQSKATRHRSTSPLSDDQPDGDTGESSAGDGRVHVAGGGEGEGVDRRADIWALGCVLYEMLTGRQTFTGETVTETLAVIRAEPGWSRLPAGTPIRVRVLLQRCLQKDPKQRLQAIGDAGISLEEVLAGAPKACSTLRQVT
jgi:serine/threonine protein kinase